MKKPITKVLIANRGEIVRRIQTACDALGIDSVCIASEADAKSLPARMAHDLQIIGPAPAKDSYLCIPKIIEAAVKTGCNAVHPGYGFLSENPAFARAVRDAGLVFIGPTPEMIEALGNKVKARQLVSQYGVPFTRGAPGGLTDSDLVNLAEEIGFPVIIKAASGGGGRGMRIVHSRGEMAELLPRARAESLKNFGSDTVYFEQFVERPRHVEVQVLGDKYGNLVHFGTRDCSTQRRNQKVVEEAPAPFISDEMRTKIHEAALNVARSVRYESAGTVEFLVKGDQFYFLEMNTRIQVEHPVTEMITGQKLVEMQLLVANGETLPVTQEQVTFSGHAIELRLYAEDAEHDFAPTKGRLSELSWPDLPPTTLRFEAGYSKGDEVTLHYDAMIAKIVVWGVGRQQAILRAQEVLRNTRVCGVTTNLEFLWWLLRDTPLRVGPVDIHWLGRECHASKIDLFRRSNELDPAFVFGPAGTCHLEQVAYQPADGQAVVIQILHRRDGVFVASQEGFDEPSRSRASNNRDVAITTLVREVLEQGAAV
jgi:3-methylcrotonyl-CoA carboxylase alpha subunit